MAAPTPPLRTPLVHLALGGAALLIAALPLAAQQREARPAAPAVTGRWDLKLTEGGTGPALPSWLEIYRSGDRTLVGRFVAVVGSARPISEVTASGDSIRFSIPRQWEQGTGPLQVAGALTGDRGSGTLVMPDGKRYQWTATRAPTLRRAAAPAWGTATPLFNGRNLDGWTTSGDRPNQWKAVGGVLTNTAGGANLVTVAKYTDFKLHLEFRHPQASNSGVYLRGRYEVQVEDDEIATEARRTTEPASTHIGGVYGFLVPNEYAGRGAGQWQTYDITLVGRRVTVVLNGKTVIADQLIPGPTGGALDSDEGAPGPLMIQGDHGPIEYRNLTITAAR